MIKKDDIPKVLDESYIEPYISKFKDKLCSDDKLAFNAMVMAYHFCIFRYPEAFESFLLDQLKPLPDEVSDILDGIEGNHAEIDWFSFNPKINPDNTNNP